MESHALLWLQLREQLQLPSGMLRQLMALAPDPRLLVNRLTDDTPAPLRAVIRRVPAVLRQADARNLLQQRLDAAACEIICLADADYPGLLAEIHDPPPLLFLRGRRELLSVPMLAIVGSRRSSHRGLDDARQFAAALASLGFGVVSGMARGIDASAHRGALDVAGTTLAVLGCGVDVCYPRSSQKLYQEIAEQGLILSEYNLGTPPLRHQFPQRNRIISGLSLGVLVVEAAVQSGSLITARQALEQNRDVFALPGSIHSPSSRGCNALIKQGAKLVETTADIVEELSGWSAGSPVLPEETPPDVLAPDSALLPLLDFAPQALDVLAARSALPIPVLLAELGELELGGWVEQQPAGWLRRR